MRTFIALFLVLAQLTPAAAFAVDVPERQELDSINLLAKKNPGFENGKTNWTASSAPTFTLASSGGNLFSPGARTAVFDASAAGQTLCSALVPVGSFQNAAAGIYTKTTATDYKLQVRDGSAVVLSEVTIAASSVFLKSGLTLLMPSSGTIRVCLVSQSNAAAIASDNAFLGESKTIQLSQASHFGGIKITDGSGADCTWNTTSGSFADYAVATGCNYAVTGNAVAPSTQLPAIKFESMPEGEYYFVGKGTFRCSRAGGDTADCQMQFHDGTSGLDVQGQYGAGLGLTSSHSGNGQILGHLSLSSASGPKTIALQARLVAASLQFISPVGDEDLKIDVYYFPSHSRTAATFATTAMSWAGYDTGTTALTSITEDDFPGGPSTLTELSNRNMGTVSASATGKGITWTPSEIGKWKVCASGHVNTSAATASGSVVLTNSSNTHLGTEQLFSQQVAGGSTPYHRCATVDIASAGTPYTVKLRGYVNSGSLDASASTDWTIENLDQGKNAPVILGGVVTPSAGVMNIASVSFAGNLAGTAVCNSDPCVLRQANGITAVNWASGANYTIHFAPGTFSAPPICTFTSLDLVSAIIATETIRPTTLQVDMSTFNAAGAQADDGANVICIGPK